MTFELKRREYPPDLIRWQRIGEAVEKLVISSPKLEVTISRVIGLEPGEDETFYRVTCPGMAVQSFGGQLMKALKLQVEEL